MDGIGTDRGCPRCGEQIRLVIATPGPDSTTDPLLRLLNIGLNDQAILLASCNCPTPRFVGLEGTPVPESKLSELSDHS